MINCVTSVRNLPPNSHLTGGRNYFKISKGISDRNRDKEPRMPVEATLEISMEQGLEASLEGYFGAVPPAHIGALILEGTVTDRLILEGTGTDALLLET